jgi:hypothetical protein
MAGTDIQGLHRCTPAQRPPSRNRRGGSKFHTTPRYWVSITQLLRLCSLPRYCHNHSPDPYRCRQRYLQRSLFHPKALHRLALPRPLYTLLAWFPPCRCRRNHHANRGRIQLLYLLHRGGFLFNIKQVNPAINSTETEAARDSSVYWIVSIISALFFFPARVISHSEIF